MVFSSMTFLWIFLPIVMLVYYICGRNIAVKNFILIVASILFYAWGEPVYVLLMLLSILVNYCIGIILAKLSKGRKVLLVLAVVVNLSALMYYKYWGFLLDTINEILNINIAYKQIEMPIGISFFTFQAMSYIFDVYRGECPYEKKISNVALYISFFPQLVAGPIVKYSDISQQMKTREASVEKIAFGIRRFCYGLGKKVIVANLLAKAVDSIVAIPVGDVSGAMAWCVMLFYSVQIYYDFSGYSDMAIGLSMMFGFRLQENFEYPYMSKSIGEFWRRWHISLGTWFREYVYIPLGGNRKGRVRTYFNLVIVFLLTGVWHGASWNFVLWGVYHGCLQIIERVGLNKILKKCNILTYVYTLFSCAVGWIFFRFTDLQLAMSYLKRIFLPWRYETTLYSVLEFVDRRTWIVFLISVLGCGILQQTLCKSKMVSKMRYKTAEVVLCAMIVFVCFVLLANDMYNPFIYFRF